MNNVEMSEKKTHETAKRSVRDVNHTESAPGRLLIVCVGLFSENLDNDLRLEIGAMFACATRSHADEMQSRLRHSNRLFSSA